MRRLTDPDFNSPAFFQMLNAVDESLGAVLRQVRYLSDEELIETFNISRSIGRKSWLIQAAILFEAQRRSVYGERALESVARRFEIGLNMAEKYARVWREFFAERIEEEVFNVEEIQLQEASWYIVAATESPDPKRWLAYAQDRKAETPSYSIGHFRADIRSATGASVQEMERSRVESLESEESVPWNCPWVKPYCTRSGRPVPADECKCDQEEPA